MDPPSFRQAPKKPETLLSPEVARAQNEALARQVARAENQLLLRARDPNAFPPIHRHAIRTGVIPPRYALPIVAGAFSAIFFPILGVSMGRSIFIGLLTAFILGIMVAAKDVVRLLRK